MPIVIVILLKPKINAIVHLFKFQNRELSVHLCRFGGWTVDSELAYATIKNTSAAARQGGIGRPSEIVGGVMNVDGVSRATADKIRRQDGGSQIAGRQQL